MPLFLFLNLQNQHDSLALFSGLTQHLPQFAESHHTSHLQIQLKLFAVTPQEKHAHHSHSAFQQTSSCSSPSCYTHKTNGDRSFFFSHIQVAMLHSIDLHNWAMSKLLINLPNSLSQTEWQTSRKYIWLTQRGVFKYSFKKSSVCCVELDLFALIVLPFLFTRQTSLWTGGRGCLSISTRSKWNFCMLPTVTGKTVCVQMYKCICVSERPTVTARRYKASGNRYEKQSLPAMTKALWNNKEEKLCRQRLRWNRSFIGSLWELTHRRTHLDYSYSLNQTAGHECDWFRRRLQG